jgi:hypothetical protein
MTAKEHLKEYIQDVLARVETRKKTKGIEPHFTTAMEFKAELRADLEAAMLSLGEEGKIHQGPTLNGDYMALT